MKHDPADILAAFDDMSGPNPSAAFHEYGLQMYRDDRFYRIMVRPFGEDHWPRTPSFRMIAMANLVVNLTTHKYIKNRYEDFHKTGATPSETLIRMFKAVELSRAEDVKYLNA